MSENTRYALLSVSNKTNLVALARGLASLGWVLIASGGTARALEDAGIACVPVDQMTGNPEAFDGRMKTISFQLEGGILYDRRNPAHVEQARRLGVTPIDMVVCNFYPFASAVSRPGCTLEEAVEQIDVGGPTMVRAAAKNFASVLVLTDPAQYEGVLEELQRGAVSDSTRRSLAVAAFDLLTQADLQVASYLRTAPERWLHLRDGRSLRYGENPQQDAVAWVSAEVDDPLALHRFEQVQGKALSYNNLLDADGALMALSLLGGDFPAAVIVKHTNPCGAAFGATAAEAFERAWAGDPLAAFGGIVALNRPLDSAFAAALGRDRFVEVLLAPAVEADAAQVLATRKNMRVLVNPALAFPVPSEADEMRSVRGGMLVQSADTHRLDVDALPVVTRLAPSPPQRRDLWMAWQICRASRSNAVSLVRDGMLVGNGVGQQDRLTACRIAVEKAGERARGAVAASDAFFPFPDGPAVLADAGVASVMQPGGSVRDQETIDLLSERGVSMVFTQGIRAFRH